MIARLAIGTLGIMHRSVAVLAFALLLVSDSSAAGTSVAGTEGTTDTRILELTEDNYDEVIENTPLILVEFYAKW